jgi:hypothetical protein
MSSLEAKILSIDGLFQQSVLHTLCKLLIFKLINNSEAKKLKWSFDLPLGFVVFMAKFDPYTFSILRLPKFIYSKSLLT